MHKEQCATKVFLLDEGGAAKKVAAGWEAAAGQAMKNFGRTKSTPKRSTAAYTGTYD